jgi:integrase
VSRRTFGSVRQRGSGRWQARYIGPDGQHYTARTEHGRALTFTGKQAADAWLARAYAAIQAGTWRPPGAPAPPRQAPVTLRAYAGTWLEGRDLSPATRKLYKVTLANQILPGLGGTAVTAITPVMVREWHAKLDTGPTQKAHAYSLLRTILNTALADDIIAANPCRVRGAGNAKRARQIKPATLAELEDIAGSVPPRYRLMILLAAWCALRFGELAELRRADIDVRAGVIRVRRGVIRGDAGEQVKGPKSEAGKRDVNIPPHLLPAVRAHLAGHTGSGRQDLLFPAANGGHMAPSSLYAVYRPAAARAGRQDLRFHDLRHTGAVLAAAAGATLAELMARLGHSTVSAAMRYQHAAADRDKAIAEALSRLAEPTPITAAKSRKTKRA